MKADKIIRNAKIYTADKNNTQVTALVVKDGKFAYVGDETGLSEYEGEVTDLGGKFIIPGILDTHVHVTIPVGFEYADLGRFAKLGVFANYTPWWHADDPRVSSSWLGKERAKKQFRCKTVWDTGALVAWSSDNITFEDFNNWNPYLGMEIGMNRASTEKTRIPEYSRFSEVFPPEDERMSIEEMLLGYTINGAKQLGIETYKGSIEAGKDADFLVFDKDLLTAEKEGFSYNKPCEVYFCGKKVN